MEITLEHISFAYTPGVPVLHDVTPVTAPNGVTALLGSNGSGKSTLLKIISGLCKPDSGCAGIDGEAIYTMSPRRRAAKIAVIPQQITNPGACTVAEVVAMGCYHRTPLAHKLPDNEKDLLAEVLLATGITHLRNRSCNELSGGEMQLVMAAQSFMQVPTGGILLADEPASMLDPARKKAFAELLRTYAPKRDITLFTTHEPALAAKYADRVILLKSGTVIASGTPDMVLTEDNLQAAYGSTPEILQTCSGLQIPFFF